MRLLAALPAAALTIGFAACSSRPADAPDHSLTAGDSAATRVQASTTPVVMSTTPTTAAPAAPAPSSPLGAQADSIAAAAARARVARDSGLRVVVSLRKHWLWVLDGRDTLRSAAVGVGMDSTLAYQGRTWNFHTPRGERRVLGKTADPKWIPPEWHYVEIARERDLPLKRIRKDEPVLLEDSSRIVVRDDEVGLVRPGEEWRPFALDEEIIQDSTLFIPPIGTKQRAVTGELGKYRLDIGNGYLLHGTPHAESIGEASSHGCIRLADDDIEWLYEHVPVGTPVITY